MSHPVIKSTISPVLAALLPTTLPGLLDVTDDGIVVVSPHAEVQFANAAARAILGLPAADQHPQIPASIVEWFDHEHPDLVTLDLNMPQMSGMEIAAAVRPAHPTLDIAMLTANFQDSIVQQARELNLRFFVKPITEQVVAGILAPYENSGRPS